MNIAVLAVVRFCLRGAIIIGVFLAIVISFQEALVFPSVLRGLQHEKGPRSAAIGESVEVLTVPTIDGTFVEGVRVAPEGHTRGFALVFHGNGDTLDSSRGLRNWLRQLGFAAFSLEYRGAGRSRGWPSERLLEQDSLALWELMCARQECDPARTLIFGYSMGSGPASFVAHKVDPRGLLLMAPFTSLRDMVAEIPLYRHLLPFLRIQFPVIDRVRTLRSTQVLVLHGERDTVVPVTHAKRFAEEYAGSSHVAVAIHPLANHVDILSHQHDLAKRWIEDHFPYR